MKNLSPVPGMLLNRDWTLGSARQSGKAIRHLQIFITNCI